MAAVRLAELEQLVDSAMSARRCLWRIACRTPHEVSGRWLWLSDDEWHEWHSSLTPPLTNEALNRLGWLETNDKGVDLCVLETHALLSAFLRRPEEERGAAALKVRADVAYLVWRNVKRTQRAAAQPDVYDAFRRLTEVLSRATASIGVELLDVSRAELHKLLRSALDELFGDPSLSSAFLDLFFDVCFSLEDLDRGEPSRGLRLRREWLDANYLLSRLYGTRTGIPGLDVLFEGGLNLADPTANPISKTRLILIRGQYSAGKSILALSLAAEVARKGGAATVVSLDDSLDALKGYISSFDLCDEVAHEHEMPTLGERQTLNERPSEGGLRLIYSKAVRENLADLLHRVERHVQEEALADRSPPGKLRLLVIDAINSLVKSPGTQSETRAQVMDTISKVRENVGNIVLVAESREMTGVSQQRPNEAWTDVLPYVADIVIDLSNDRSHGYDQRFIQISKSRFQRERRGRHPFSIVPGRGLAIAPSSPAFSSEITRPHWPAHTAVVAEPTRPIQFGLRDFDQLLGEGGLAQGDSIALRGPQGSFKTLLGLHFLAGEGEETPRVGVKRRSLFLTDREHVSLEAYSDAYRLALPRPLRELVTLAPLPGNYIRPGQLLEDIQTHFREARAQGFIYDRVLIANIGRWDVRCPFVKEDLAFGTALMDLLRAECASAVIICAEKQMERESYLQRSIVDRATTLIDFQRVEYGGAQRTLMRVVRGRSAPQSRDWQELTLQGGRLQIDPSLLRVLDRGEGSPPAAEVVKTTLHLYQAGEMQEKYNEKLRSRLETMLTTPVGVLGSDRAMLTEASRLGPLSVGSHLQLVQVDEFQLPTVKHSSDGRSLLQPYLASSLKARWDDDEDVRRAITRYDGGENDSRATVVAFPYYRNIGLLTSSDSRSGQEPPTTWDELAELSKKYPKSDKLFFNSAKRPEDYNCVFFEIALSLKQAQSSAHGGERGSDFPKSDDSEESAQRLRDWIASDAFKHALELFHVMCAPAHKLTVSNRDEQLGPSPWASVFSRQWFTSLHYWLRGDAKTRPIRVMPLPGNVAISGEWYLGVWAHSAVPEIGLKILESLTSPEAQLERLWLGIGLPVTSNLFNEDALQLFPNHQPTRDLNLAALVQNAKRRSHVYKYHLFSPVLAYHLVHFLDSSSLRSELIEDTVTRLVASFDKVRKH